MAVILPEHVLKLVSPADRKALGRAGLTAIEAQAKWQAKDERTLQRDVANLLRLRGIEVFSQRMDKRTRGKVGQPDFLMAIKGVAIAWELKAGTGKLSQEQATMLHRLSLHPNGWRVAIIRSVNDALIELQRHGL